jgi:hypothetical protein
LFIPTYQTARYHIPEDHHLGVHHCMNTRSHPFIVCFGEEWGV